jgi:assimilatory nitrate reductase catalytic subunit
MGFADAFAYSSPAEIFAEHAALSSFENDGERDFDIGAFAGIDRKSFDRMQPFQWPRPRPGAHAETRFFADGGFYTEDRKARIVPVHSASLRGSDPAFPLILNTGRVRDHWHTMTRTGRSARLSQHFAEPFAEIHPDDARALGVADADIVRVSTARGAILVRALLSNRQSLGSVFVPMHWTDQFAGSARVGTLVPSVTDPHSGQPALKHVPVRLERFTATKYGFAVLAERPSAFGCPYWAIARCDGGFRLELAFAEAEEDWHRVAASLFAAPPGAETLAYHDMATGQHRFACFDGDRLVGALFLASEPVSVLRAWTCEQLTRQHPGQRARMAVIAGRPSIGSLDRGAVVCSCFGIGANQIASAVARGCTSVREVGQALGAGTNCGSCRGEISRLIEQRRPTTESQRAIIPMRTRGVH